MSTQIGFFTNVVTDMARARKFYEGVLGLEPTMTKDNFTEYEIGPATLALGLQSGPFAPSSDGASIALEVDDLEKAVAHLKKHDVKFAMEVFETPVCHTGVFLDPDGNKLMIHKRHPVDQGGAEAHSVREGMVTEVAFVAYPVTDVPKARAFYEETLGLKNTMAHEMAPGRWWIEYDVAGQTLALASLGDDWKPSEKGSAVALEVDDFDATIADLETKGLSFFIGPMDCGKCHMAGIADPDGSKLVIHKLKAMAA